MDTVGTCALIGPHPTYMTQQSDALQPLGAGFPHHSTQHFIACFSVALWWHACDTWWQSDASLRWYTAHNDKPSTSSVSWVQKTLLLIWHSYPGFRYSTATSTSDTAQLRRLLIQHSYLDFWYSTATYRLLIQCSYLGFCRDYICTNSDVTDPHSIQQWHHRPLALYNSDTCITDVLPNVRLFTAWHLLTPIRPIQKPLIGLDA